jgi:hypothetical protein
MRLSRWAGAGVLLALVAATAESQPTVLVAGTELVYESGGVAGAPWRVDVVEPGLSLGGRTGCLRVRFAAGGPRPGPDERVTCAADGVLYAWDTTGHLWRASRPIAPNQTLDIATRTGRSRYTTGESRDEVVAGIRMSVIETTVLTIDSAGRAVRRLRELYAPAIGTAAWGVFETPDPQVDGGWRVVQEFRLVAIRKPGG